MKVVLTVASALITGLFFNSSAIAEEPAEWLFVHTAASAEMSSDTTLVMPVTREIFAFTDRPNRLHVYMNPHEFALLWGEGDTFKSDPPNAVLTWFDGDEMKESEVVITGASVSVNGRSISYDVSVEAGTLLPHHQSVGGVSLFIDSTKCLSCLYLQ